MFSYFKCNKVHVFARPPNAAVYSHRMLSMLRKKVLGKRSQFTLVVKDSSWQLNLPSSEMGADSSLGTATQRLPK